jgi:fluoride exporter
MVNLLLVFVGGGTGAVARYLFGVGYGRALGPSTPFPATFAINVLGGLLMGLLVGLLALKGGAGQERWRLLLAVGVLGGFTTFSSFSLESVLMIERRAYGLAAAYVGASVVLSILAVMLGLFVMRRLAP